MASSTLIDPTKNIGKDSTATFESDPKFIEPTPGSEGSSDNVEEQRDTDDTEDSEEELEDSDEDDDVDEDEEFDDEDADDESLSDEDEDLDEDDDEDEDAEEDDDADEVAAASSSSPEKLHADGVLGYEDEAEDAEMGRSERQGNADRARAEDKLGQPTSTRGTGRATDTEGDDDAGDVAPGVTEDEYTDDDMDTDRVAALPLGLMNWPVSAYGFREYIGTQPSTFGTLQ